MSAPQKSKRHHHHVWQNYLRPWTVGGALYCLQDGRIFSTGTRVVAVEKDFYKLHQLTAEHVALIKLLFGQGHPAAVKAHAHLLNRLMIPFQIAEQVKNSLHREQIDAYLDDYASDVLEDYHASIEASFILALENALKPMMSARSSQR
jgi:metal-dependent HD superfamily phosphatase/phosphodiesterase